ncbi:pseudouridine synthase [Saxibacter everestensis]|uniref:RNA pseudouridylate synthase n=1 Tax=Saxibacter everestensis TaxID=2909229 RepID=A0ABY8QVL8_9MICO|nr:pseudouridine synthase [Brevibacteriaceae bacterium ZFBP1038]
MPSAPLPIRHGINPTRLRLPDDGVWPTVREYLLDRFPDQPAAIEGLFDAGDIVYLDGKPLSRHSPFRRDEFVWYHREVAAEERVPFEVETIFEDAEILVVDKPHFLASTPNGRFVIECVVTRLRRERNEPDLVAIHRLDRVTAGLLVLSRNPATRGRYQLLFQNRQIRKEYEALAGFDPELEFPITVRNRLGKPPGTRQTLVLDGEPNAETRIELLERLGDVARYRLLPHTGKTHQLRVHLNALGIPIVGDTLYPNEREIARDDYSSPLQLIARRLSFEDPLTGEPRTFTSRRMLREPGDLAVGRSGDAASRS